MARVYFAGRFLAGRCPPSRGRLAASRAHVVKHREGLVHGFLALRTLEGEVLAAGDLIQQARSDRVTSRLVFAFKDGSRHDGPRSSARTATSASRATGSCKKAPRSSIRWR